MFPILVSILTFQMALWWVVYSSFKGTSENKYVNSRRLSIICAVLSSIAFALEFFYDGFLLAQVSFQNTFEIVYNIYLVVVSAMCICAFLIGHFYLARYMNSAKSVTNINKQSRMSKLLFFTYSMIFLLIIGIIILIVQIFVSAATLSLVGQLIEFGMCVLYVACFGSSIFKDMITGLLLKLKLMAPKDKKHSAIETSNTSASQA